MDSGDNWLGVASILISAVALAGVAYSLVLQSHALRVAQAQATRATQIELIRMLIENPQIETPFAHDRDGRGAYLHLNLLMKHHEFGFLIGDSRKDLSALRWHRFSSMKAAGTTGNELARYSSPKQTQSARGGL
jgi:hypothetical protein